MTNTAQENTAVASEKEVAAEKAVVVKDTKNGVTRPGQGTATGRVWEICDTIQAGATPENPITRARVIKAAEAEDINVSTAATQYGRWRKYNGLERETAKAVVASTDGSAEVKPKKTKKAKATEAAAPVIEDTNVEATGADAAPQAPEVATPVDEAPVDEAPDYLEDTQSDA